MAIQDFEMFSGDSKNINVTPITDNSTGELYDFTGVNEIKWKIMFDGTSLVKKYTENQIIVNGNGDITIFVLPEDTEDHSGKFSHELEIIDANLNVYTAFRAIITINPDIIE